MVKKPRAEAKHWYNPKESEPNATEMLFFAFLLCYDASSVAELNSWAENVVTESSEAMQLRQDWHAGMRHVA